MEEFIPKDKFFFLCDTRNKFWDTLINFPLKGLFPFKLWILGIVVIKS